MKLLDLLGTLIYGLCGGLKCAAELIGYWFIIVFVVFICNEDVNGSVALWAMAGSAGMALGTRALLNWLE